AWSAAGALAGVPGVAALVPREPGGADDTGGDAAGLSLGQRVALCRQRRSRVDLRGDRVHRDGPGGDEDGGVLGHFPGCEPWDRGGGGDRRREGTLARGE